LELIGDHKLVARNVGEDVAEVAAQRAARSEKYFSDASRLSGEALDEHRRLGIKYNVALPSYLYLDISKPIYPSRPNDNMSLGEAKLYQQAALSSVFLQAGEEGASGNLLGVKAGENGSWDVLTLTAAHFNAKLPEDQKLKEGSEIEITIAGVKVTGTVQKIANRNTDSNSPEFHDIELFTINIPPAEIAKITEKNSKITLDYLNQNLVAIPADATKVPDGDLIFSTASPNAESGFFRVQDENGNPLASIDNTITSEDGEQTTETVEPGVIKSNQHLRVRTVSGVDIQPTQSGGGLYVTSVDPNGVATITLAGFLSGKTNDGGEGLFSTLSEEDIALIQAQGFNVRTATPNAGVTSRAASSIGAPVVITSTDTSSTTTPPPSTSSTTPDAPSEEENNEPATVASPTTTPPPSTPP
jgi:hypothetical protein